MVSLVMQLDQSLSEISQGKNILAVCYVDDLDTDYELCRAQIKKFCMSNYKQTYELNDRLVFVMSKDFYHTSDIGVRLETIQRVVNEIDIPNFFVIVITTNESITSEMSALSKLSTDRVPITVVKTNGLFQRQKVDSPTFAQYRYGSVEPVKISLDELSEKERYLLTNSKVFCIYPWIHLHAYPTGAAYPCCHSEMSYPVGDCKSQTLQEIWSGEPMRRLRDDMLHERENPGCNRCYEQERSGFFSGRKSANKHHGHHIHKLESNPFEMTYWDIRFSNLCNLSCRSCGHIFSSSWYQDQTLLAGPEWAAKHKPLNFAGRTEIDIWEQLVPHLDYVEQIYFAGGEPLMMDEHYRILEELERRGRFDVRLIYNTNFTLVKLKKRYVFDYWRKFKSVAVGASLDAMGPRAEYIRKGTDWAVIEKNRRMMLEICPHVDFYISPTLSIMNALHVPDFHKTWVEEGLIKPQDLNVNILQHPKYLRIDIAPPAFKQKISEKFQSHLEWLRPQDDLKRASVGFESAINFLMATDNSNLLPTFWLKTKELDAIRSEDCLASIPELEALL